MHFCPLFLAKIMQNANASVLFLVPMPISEIDINWSIPLNVLSEISKIQVFIAENAKTARHFLKQVNPAIIWSEIEVIELDKHHISTQIEELKHILTANPVVGLMSEAGLPCIADPGNLIVRAAHELGIRVRPLSGPSSIVLALIASGMNGQDFRFNGYVPSKPDERKKAIQQLEKLKREATQLFIEAPYRNEKMLEDLIRTLQPDTRLMVAKDITGEDEWIVSQPVSWWRKQNIVLGKVPCLFAIGQ
jgi:16S rRNA (cytidine1402-2'-O)-methyltransferase